MVLRIKLEISEKEIFKFNNKKVRLSYKQVYE